MDEVMADILAKDIQEKLKDLRAKRETFWKALEGSTAARRRMDAIKIPSNQGLIVNLGRGKTTQEEIRNQLDEISREQQDIYNQIVYKAAWQPRIEACNQPNGQFGYLNEEDIEALLTHHQEDVETLLNEKAEDEAVRPYLSSILKLIASGKSLEVALDVLDDITTCNPEETAADHVSEQNIRKLLWPPLYFNRTAALFKERDDEGLTSPLEKHTARFLQSLLSPNPPSKVELQHFLNLIYSNNPEKGTPGHLEAEDIELLLNVFMERIEVGYKAEDISAILGVIMPHCGGDSAVGVLDVADIHQLLFSALTQIREGHEAQKVINILEHMIKTNPKSDVFGHISKADMTRLFSDEYFEAVYKEARFSLPSYLDLTRVLNPVLKDIEKYTNYAVEGEVLHHVIDSEEKAKAASTLIKQGLRDESLIASLRVIAGNEDVAALTNVLAAHEAEDDTFALYLNNQALQPMFLNLLQHDTPEMSQTQSQLKELLVTRDTRNDYQMIIARLYANRTARDVDEKEGTLNFIQYLGENHLLDKLCDYPEAQVARFSELLKALESSRLFNLRDEFFGDPNLLENGFELLASLDAIHEAFKKEIEAHSDEPDVQAQLREAEKAAHNALLKHPYDIDKGVQGAFNAMQSRLASKPDLFVRIVWDILRILSVVGIAHMVWNKCVEGGTAFASRAQSGAEASVETVQKGFSDLKDEFKRARGVSGADDIAPDDIVPDDIKPSQRGG